MGNGLWNSQVSASEQRQRRGPWVASAAQRTCKIWIGDLFFFSYFTGKMGSKGRSYAAAVCAVRSEPAWVLVGRRRTQLVLSVLLPCEHSVHLS